MLRPRVLRGALAARVGDFITSRVGAPFTSHDAILWLPQFGPQSVRTHLHKLARAGKITSAPLGTGKECVYREITDAPESRGYGRTRVTNEFLDLLYLWAQRGPVCGDRIPAHTGRYLGAANEDDDLLDSGPLGLDGRT